MKPLTLLFSLPAAASFAYGLVVCLVRSGSRFYLFWWLLALFFAFLAFMQQKTLWARVPRPVRLAGGIFLAFCLAVLVITQALVLSQVRARGKADLDCIIVLGSQVTKSGPAVVTTYRLRAAEAYAKENPETLIIVSGGQGANEPAPEAVVMKAWLVDQGIPADRILTEEKSRNTAENIAFSRQLIEEAAESSGSEEASGGDMDTVTPSVGIVTNDFHVFRAVHLARAAGLRNACGIAAGSVPLYFPNNAVRESFGIVKDLLAGNLN